MVSCVVVGVRVVWFCVVERDEDCCVGLLIVFFEEEEDGGKCGAFYI